MNIISVMYEARQGSSHNPGRKHNRTIVKLLLPVLSLSFSSSISKTFLV